MRIPAGNIFTNSPGDVTFEEGKTLIELVGVHPDHAAYCDKDVSWTSRNPIDGRRLRFCLMDEQRDGTFDYLMAMGTAQDDRSALFAHTLTLGEANRPIAVPYTLQEGEAPLMTFGMTVTKGMLGAYRVEPVAIRGEELVQLDSNDEVTTGEERGGKGGGKVAGTFFRSNDLPLTLSLNGASIEIAAVDGDLITYRMLSPFDSNMTLEVPYNGPLPLERR